MTGVPQQTAPISDDPASFLLHAAVETAILPATHPQQPV